MASLQHNPASSAQQQLILIMPLLLNIFTKLPFPPSLHLQRINITVSLPPNFRKPKTMVLLYYRPNQFSSIYEHPSRIPRQPSKPTILSALKPPQTTTHIALLESCIHSGSLDQGRLVHSMIGADPPDPFVGAKLVSMYCKCGGLEDARVVFESLRVRNIFAWSAMIGGCARDHRWTDVVKLFYRMVGDDGLIPDGLLFPKILQACANSGDVETGVLLHSLALRKSVSSPSLVHVNNALLAMYTKCGELASARRLFDGMDGHRDRVTWNSIISGYCRCGDHVEAMRMFERMRGEGFDPGVVTWNIVIASCCERADGPDRALLLMEEMAGSGVMPDVFTWTTLISGFTQKDRPMKGLELFREMLCAGAGVRPNGMTIAAALSACASVKALKLGKEIHSFAIKTGSDTNVLVGNSLIDMYAKSGELDSSRSVFYEIKESERDVFTWNSIISAYTQNGDCEMAHKLFLGMGSSRVCRNAITWNVMISGYLQNGDEDRAMQHFRVMESDGGIKRNTASWNLLISGVLQHGRKIKALEIFREMQFNDSRPNLVTILSILPACANLVSTSKVKEIHCSVLRGGLESELLILNSLIDTYSKSGDIFSARSVFEGMSFRDVVSWNSLISGYLLHGCPEIALELFELMKEGGVTPNWITLAGVLFAYSHLGKVNEGKNLFSKMMEDHQLIPRLQHFEAMVDLLGRSGRLTEANEFIKNMPIDPNYDIWYAFLIACRNHGNIRLAIRALEHMIELKPEDSVIYGLLLQLNALGGKEASRVNKPKQDNRKSISRCKIEVNNWVHTFCMGNQCMPNSEFIHAKISSIAGLGTLKSEFLPNHLQVEEEEKEEVGGTHCEKLACTFALICCPSYRSIRIIKRVRMCVNCHAMAKYISKEHVREILLKDPKCLHHFKNGRCSCKDYW